MIRGHTTLHLDFQRRPGAPRRAFGAVLLALGGAALIAAATHYSALGTETAALQDQLAAARGVQQRQARPAEGDRALSDRMRAADRVLDQLAVSWGALFEGIEKAAGEQVTLLTLQADPAQRVVRVSGEARDFGAVTAYVRRLEETDVLSDVQLSGHEVRQQDPRRPIAFTLVATWENAP